MMVRNTEDIPRVIATVEDEDTMRYGGSRFVRERTCRNVEKGYGWFKCSECGVAFETEDDMGYTVMMDEHGKPVYGPYYCPNCGALVMVAVECRA